MSKKACAEKSLCSSFKLGDLVRVWSVSCSHLPTKRFIENGCLFGVKGPGQKAALAYFEARRLDEDARWSNVGVYWGPLRPCDMEQS